VKSQHTKKVLIVGDSFAADWRVKYPDQLGWPNLLAQEYSVTNLAQAGCSEYRIYQQLKTTNIDHFDLILVSHTSAYRIYTEYHPARRDTALHKNCDLLYSDIEDLSQTQEEYKSVSTYFQKFFSLEFAEFTHELIWEKNISANIKGNCNTLHTRHPAAWKLFGFF
jgi:hypothetical protein